MTIYLEVIINYNYYRNVYFIKHILSFYLLRNENSFLKFITFYKTN